MCSRPVGRIPLNTLLLFPSALFSNPRLLVLVVFVSILHLSIKSFFESLHELEPLDRLFARKLDRSLVQHRHHGLAPFGVGIIQRRIHCVRILVSIIHWQNHRLQSHFGSFQQSGIFLRVSLPEDVGHCSPLRGYELKPLHELANSATTSPTPPHPPPLPPPQPHHRPAP